MKTKSNFKKFVKRNINNLMYGGSALILAAGIILSEIIPSSEKVTKVLLRDGRTATYLESKGALKNSLYVHKADGFARAFYTKKDSCLEYTNSDKKRFMITEKGFSVFNDTIAKYEDFVPFENDSALYWVKKDYADIISQIDAEKAIRSRLEGITK